MEPTQLTVEEIENEVADVDDLDTLQDALSAEEDGDDRTTAKDAIVARIDEVTATDGGDDDESSSDDDEQEEREEIETEVVEDVEEGVQIVEMDVDRDQDEELEGLIPDGYVGYDVQAHDVEDYTRTVQVEWQEPPVFTAPWEEVPKQLRNRLAFAQELLGDDTEVGFTEQELDGGYDPEGDTIVFSEAGLRTGQDRDHKTQWMHKIATLLGDEFEVSMDTQLEVMGNVEYDGISNALDHQLEG